MSTNEELVARIWDGESDCMAALWDRVEKLVRWKAWRVVAAIDESGISSGAGFEDLYQCGYFALVAAVASYKPGSCAFTTCFMNCLKTEFAEATGYRTKKQMQDPLRRAISLDLPIGEDEETSFAEILPDPAAEAAFTAIERKERCEALRAVLNELPNEERRMIEKRYFCGMGLAETAKAIGVSDREAQKLESSALRHLRHPSRAKRIWK